MPPNHLSSFLLRTCVSFGVVCIWLMFLPAPLGAAVGPPLLRDQHGTPLPFGARVRLGASRWRVPSSVVLSQDGRLLATDTRNGAVDIAGSTTGKLQQRLRIAGQALYPHGFSPDGRFLVTGDVEVDVRRVWNIATGKQVCAVKLGLDKFEVFDLPPAFLPGGKQLATWDFEKHRVMFWDAGTGKVVRSERCPWARGEESFSPNGRLFCLRTTSDSFALLNLETGKWYRIRVPAKPAMEFHCWSPDSRLLALVDRDNTRVSLFDATTGQQRQSFSSPDYQASRTRFSQDGRHFLIRKGGDLEILDVQSGKRHGLIKNLGVEGYSRFPNYFGLGESLLTITPDPFAGFVRLFDVRTGKNIDRRSGHWSDVISLAFTADGRTLVSMSAEDLCRWDTRTGRQLSRSDDLGALGSLSLSADGRLAAISPQSGMAVCLIDVPRGRVVRIRKIFFPTEEDSNAHLFAPQPAPCSLSADGSLLTVGKSGVVTKDDVGCIEVRRTDTDRLLHVVKLPPQGPHVFSPSGEDLAVVVERERNTEVELIDLGTGKSRRRITVPRTGEIIREPRILAIGFSHDGRTLAGADFAHAYCWECASGQLLDKAPLPPGLSARHLLITPAEQVIVAGRRKAQWVIWDMGSRRIARTIPSSPSDKQSEAFSTSALTADGGTLALTQPDSSILLYGVPLPAVEKVPPAGGADLPGLWSDLASDAPRAIRAADRLANSRSVAVELLRKQLVSARAKVSARLLSDLDSSDYSVRETATKKLAIALDRRNLDVELALRDLLGRKPSLEVHRRVERLLIAHAKPVKYTPEELRHIRAVAVLERIGSPEALALLKKLAGGAPAVLTREARASLKRLRSR